MNSERLEPLTIYCLLFIYSELVEGLFTVYFALGYRARYMINAENAAIRANSVKAVI